MQATLENTVWSETGLRGGTGAAVVTSKATAEAADTHAAAASKEGTRAGAGAEVHGGDISADQP